MNFLHQSYIKSGKILNKDLLYVLYASMKEPVRFMKQYEWRSLTDMEVVALAQHWKYVGEMMEIDYASELGKSEWTDGIQFMEELEIWASKYEDDHMKALPEIQELGSVLLELLLSSYPSFVRPIGYQAVTTLLGDRLRRAFGLVYSFTHQLFELLTSYKPTRTQHWHYSNNPCSALCPPVCNSLLYVSSSLSS